MRGISGTVANVLFAVSTIGSAAVMLPADQCEPHARASATERPADDAVVRGPFSCSDCAVCRFKARHEHTGWSPQQWAEHYASALPGSAGAVVGWGLPDGSRADIVTRRHAFAVVPARHWKEGVGCALHYAEATSKSPVLLLLLHRGDDDVQAIRLAIAVCKRANIRLITLKIPPPAC